MPKQALEGRRLNAFALDPDHLKIVGIDTEDGPEHPLYDERIGLKVSEALIANVKTFGIIEPVIVAKIDDAVLVVDGRQRVRAARAANEELRSAGCEPVTVPVMLRRGDDGHLVGVMISANEQRADDELPIKLKKLERLLSIGRSEKEAACVFGVSLQTIKNWLSLLEAGPELKTAVAAGRITPTAATQLAKLPRADQAQAAQEAATAASNGTPLTVERANQFKRQKQTGAAAPLAPTKKRIREICGTELATLPVPPQHKEGFLLALRWVLGEAPDLEGEPSASSRQGDDSQASLFAGDSP